MIVDDKFDKLELALKDVIDVQPFLTPEQRPASVVCFRAIIAICNREIEKLGAETESMAAARLVAVAEARVRELEANMKFLSESVVSAEAENESLKAGKLKYCGGCGITFATEQRFSDHDC